MWKQAQRSAGIYSWLHSMADSRASVLNHSTILPHHGDLKPPPLSVFSFLLPQKYIFILSVKTEVSKFP